jgi:hypothetical protein
LSPNRTLPTIWPKLPPSMIQPLSWKKLELPGLKTMAQT